MKQQAKNTTRFIPIILALMLGPCLSLRAAGRRGTARALTGILYSVDGGTGGGTIRLYDGKSVVTLSYENPRDDRGFRKIEDYYLGAVVKAQVRRDGGGLALERMSYTGRFDPTVKSADEFIYNHFSLLAVCNYELAFGNLSAQLRAGRPFEEFVGRYRDARFSTRANNRWLLPGPLNRYAVPTYGTKFVKHSQRQAVVLVSMYTFIERNFEHYRYALTRAGDSWSISEIAGITADEFGSP